MIDDLFGSHALAQDGPCSITIGLQTWQLLHHAGDVLWRSDSDAIEEEQDFAFRSLPDLDRAAADDWQRWSAGDQADTIVWRPALPDLPVVVRPRHPLRLAAGSDLDLYISLPLFLQIGCGDWSSGSIVDAPTVPMSKTWFGTRIRGEVAYALKSRGRRLLAEMDPLPAHRCCCPVLLRNRSGGVVQVERILIRSNQLHLYRADALWTNRVTVHCLTGSGDTEVEHDQRPPPQHPAATTVAEPRVVGRSLFHSLSIF